MANYNGKSFQDPRNINLKGGVTGTGLIRWSPPAQGSSAQNWASNPFGTLDYGLYINSTGKLVFSSLGATTVLGGGGGGTPSWETLFAADQTFSLAGTTWTIDNTSGASNVLTLTNSGAGAGNVLQITNAGSGKDINGTSNTWSVTKAGAAVFVSIDVPAITSSANLALGCAGAGVVTIGVNSNTITLAKAATFSATLTVTDGITLLQSTSNVANSVTVINNTVTTYGNASADTGVFVIKSTSLTTGTLLKLQLTEGTLNGGWYLNCYDVTGTASVFSIGEDGLTTIAGAGGSNVLVLTAGDMLMSDGSITIIDADNAATLSITNDTATTNSVFVFAGSGIFTGTTTTSFMTLTPSGMTTGTALYIAAAAATTSVGVVDIISASLTTGSLLRLTTSTAAFTTGGKALEISLVSATAGNGITITTGGAYAGTGLITLSATGMTSGTGILMASSEAALTTGKYVNLGGVFTVAKYGATVIAGNAATTVFTITAGHAVITSGNLTLTSGNVVLTSGTLTLTSGSATLTSGDLILTANASKISFTGTGANGGILLNLKNSAPTALSGAQKDIEISIGGVPYYFTVYPVKA